MRKGTCFVSFFIGCIVFGQNKRADSLIHILPTVKQDTQKLKLLTTIVFSLCKNEPERALQYSQQELSVAENANNQKGIINAYINRGLANYYLDKYSESVACYKKAEALIGQMPADKQPLNSRINLYNYMGITYQQMGKADDALIAFQKTLELKKKTNDTAMIATAYLNMGVVYYKKGDFNNALGNYLSAARLRESMKDMKGAATVYNNIGVIYVEQGQNEKGLSYYERSLKLDERSDDKKGTALTLNNIGIVYFNQKKYNDALAMMKRSLKMREESNDKRGIDESSSNLAGIYEELNDLKNAEFYIMKSIAISEEIEDVSGTVYGLQGLSRIKIKQGKFNDAVKLLERSISLAKQSGAQDELMQSYLALANCLYKNNEPKRSADYYQLYIAKKDSLYNAESSEQMAEMQTKYESDKKEHENKLLSKDNQLKNNEIESHKQTRNYIVGIALLILIFSIFLVKSIRKTKKQNFKLSVYNKQVITQNNEIIRQKELVEEHQKEIIDSITYAKRLQQAILPSDAVVDRFLPDNFIYYQPKDIVAGDFYWMEHLDGITFIAAADSTGHGVPGAMVSIVCSNALNRAVKEFGLRETGKILDKTRDLVLETFAKSTSDVKDGMDISLLAIAENKRDIFWSGANNPLWYFDAGTFKEIKADKQPIGKTDNPAPFTTHALSRVPGMVLYLMTDGYPDQFGGPKGKKFKYKQLEDILATMHSNELSDQKTILSERFDNWKGDLEQVDDVTIIGVRM